MATKPQVKAIIEAAMLASDRGFRPRGTPGLDIVHTHNDCIVDGLFAAIEEFSIKSFYDPTGGLPADPVLGDAYIASATTGGWTANTIYSWDGSSSWVATVPRNGMQVWIDGEDKFYYYNDGAWVDMLAVAREWPYGWRIFTTETEWKLQKYNPATQLYEDTKFKVKVIV